MKPSKSCHWLADNDRGVACQNCQKICSCSDFKVGESCLEEEEEEEEDDFPYPIEDWPRRDTPCAWDSNLSKMSSRKCSVCQKDFVNNNPCDCHTSLIRGNIKGKNCKMKPDQENSNTTTSKTEGKIIKLSKAAVSQEYEKILPCAKDVGYKMGKICLECAFKSSDKTIILQEDNDNDDERESIKREHKDKLKNVAKKVDEEEEQGPCFSYSDNKEGKVCASCNSKNPKSDEDDIKHSELGEEISKTQNMPCSWLSKSQKGRQCAICSSDSTEKNKKK